MVIDIREKSALAECEEIIERGLVSFVEVGTTLLRAKTTLPSAEYRKFCLQMVCMHPDEVEPLLEIMEAFK